MSGSVFLTVRFHAAPYERWSEVLNGVVETSVRHGGLGHRVLRSLEDEREYVLEFEFTSFGGAKGFAEAEPALLQTWALTGADPHHTEAPPEYFEGLNTTRYEPDAEIPHVLPTFADATAATDRPESPYTYPGG